jgi:hypothetical protein
LGGVDFPRITFADTNSHETAPYLWRGALSNTIPILSNVTRQAPWPRLFIARRAT